ncbi:formate/nitrite transporter family protein [Blastococcus sp. MG754426]|uniref:formate/nitrite transporter family protein n=1 Tax=unclassified Blastococcus TaxID=2619396 RepID=UPI001EF07B8B|nr:MULTISPECIES: formate/nitrite transporter family protein [unclassified Blastococcus]MCF6506457.1 formate/nitrite transporter family protein [Blastococcus sp. MG754426]MCF6511258.1 formate/nitrite transporter family protein [Blastococcus sp. MG754427]MCF6736825.1 formate/nitrite transporter family protein [Blastococcus sp. KM273129]
MGVAPNPDSIYERSTDEGDRRLSLSLLDQVSTAFIAGVTIIFGIIALGVVEGLVAQSAASGVGRVAGALAFAIGLVFLVVGRSELFTENFFDPVAAAVEHRERHPWTRLLRLWGVTLVLNLVGGGLLVALLTVDGALPSEATHTLSRVAEEIASKGWAATLVRAVLAGALITLLSYMLNAVDTVTGRILLAYMVGFFLALGPFDHVVVSALHLLLGVWLDGAVGYGAVATNLGLATVGNLLGGVLLITVTHTARAKSG